MGLKCSCLEGVRSSRGASHQASAPVQPFKSQTVVALQVPAFAKVRCGNPEEKLMEAVGDDVAADSIHEDEITQDDWQDDTVKAEDSIHDDEFTKDDGQDDMVNAEDTDVVKEPNEPALKGDQEFKLAVDSAPESSAPRKETEQTQSTEVESMADWSGQRREAEQFEAEVESMPDWSGQIREAEQVETEVHSVPDCLEQMREPEQTQAEAARFTGDFRLLPPNGFINIYARFRSEDPPTSKEAPGSDSNENNKDSIVCLDVPEEPATSQNVGDPSPEEFTTREATQEEASLSTAKDTKLVGSKVLRKQLSASGGVVKAERQRLVDREDANRIASTNSAESSENEDLQEPPGNSVIYQDTSNIYANAWSEGEPSVEQSAPIIVPDMDRVDVRRGFLPVTIQVAPVEGDIVTNCFCGFNSCCKSIEEEPDFSVKDVGKMPPTMVSHGERLDVIWRVVAKTYIRKELAPNSARLYPLEVGDSITVTAIISAELRVISPAVGWVSLVSPGGEPLVMIGQSEATEVEEYPAVDFGAAFMSSFSLEDVSSASVIAADLCKSGGPAPRHIAAVRRALAEGRVGWRNISKMFDQTLSQIRPSASCTTAKMLQAAILSADSAAADEILRRPRPGSEPSQLRDTMPPRFTTMLEELLAITSLRNSKAYSQTDCEKAKVWENVLQTIARDKDRAAVTHRLAALHDFQKAVFVVQADSTANCNGVFVFMGEEENRPAYRLKQLLETDSNYVIRWFPWSREQLQQGGEEGEWRIITEGCDDPLFRATGSWMPPTSGWLPAHRNGSPPCVRLELSEAAAQQPSVPPFHHTSCREVNVIVEGPAEEFQRSLRLDMAAQISKPLPEITSETPPPMWLAAFVEKQPPSSKCEADAKAANEFPQLRRISFGLETCNEQTESERRYARFPPLSAQHCWQLVSLHRLVAVSSAIRVPAVDLLSGLGDDAPEDDHIISFDENGRAYVSPVELAEVLRKLGHPPHEVELWKMAAANGEDSNLDLADVLAVLACKLDGSEDPLDDQKLKAAFKTLDQQGRGQLGFEDLKQGTLKLRPTLAHYGLADLSIEFTKTEVTDMICQADTNRDGLVSYEEFATAVRMVAPATDD